MRERVEKKVLVCVGAAKELRRCSERPDQSSDSSSDNFLYTLGLGKSVWWKSELAKIEGTRVRVLSDRSSTQPVEWSLLAGRVKGGAFANRSPF